MSTLKVDTIQDKNTIHSSTTAQLFSGRVKVWWNYAQRTGPAISKSYNVSSITDEATGNYTVNFAITCINPCGSTSSSYNDNAFDGQFSDMANLYTTNTKAEVMTPNIGVGAAFGTLYDCDFNYGFILDTN